MLLRCFLGLKMGSEAFFRWAFTAIFTIASTFAGLVLNKYATAFDNWAMAVQQARSDISLLSAQQKICEKNIEKVFEITQEMPPSPTRERIETMEDYLQDQGYRRPHHKWR